MSEPTDNSPIDPRVVRRTLTIALTLFGIGFVLSGLWVYREARRVKNIERLPQSERIPEDGLPLDPLKSVPAKTNSTVSVGRRSASTAGMVWIPSGRFRRGNDQGAMDEQPVRELTVDGFWIDRTEVTNEQFAEFVKATGYVTLAERMPDAAQYPGVPREKLVPGAAVFRSPKEQPERSDFLSWWEYVPGASWRHPEGPETGWTGREKHPVVQVCWFDAQQYAEWAGKRLPAEAEWEYAARGGLDGNEFVWGSEMLPGGHWQANIWQGDFPMVNRSEDGFLTTAPVGSFPPNRFGLHDMAGNVWEWCADWYRSDYYEQSPAQNPHGPDTSVDPDEPGVMKRVQRGGSFLCNDSYCGGYRPSARMKASPDTALGHSGFRCALTAAGPVGEMLRR